MHAFLHLTLQEYLAALHWSKSSPQLQQLLSREDLFPISVLVKSGIGKECMAAGKGYHWPVLLLWGGLSKLQQVEADFFKSIFSEEFHP